MHDDEMQNLTSISVNDTFLCQNFTRDKYSAYTFHIRNRNDQSFCDDV